MKNELMQNEEKKSGIYMGFVTYQLCKTPHLRRQLFTESVNLPWVLCNRAPQTELRTGIKVVNSSLRKMP